MCKMLCITVTQDDIDESEYQFTDPIREAILREYALDDLDGYPSASGATGIYIGDTWFDYPDDVVNWMTDFDLGKTVKPIAFVAHSFCEGTSREDAMLALEKESKCL